MTIRTFTFGPFQTNTYVVSDEQGNILLIDPACFGQREQQMLQDYIDALIAKGQRLTAILATHGHLDHLWGAPWATEQFGVPVLVPTAGPSAYSRYPDGRAHATAVRPLRHPLASPTLPYRTA